MLHQSLCLNTLCDFSFINTIWKFLLIYPNYSAFSSIISYIFPKINCNFILLIYQFFISMIVIMCAELAQSILSRDRQTGIFSMVHWAQISVVLACSVPSSFLQWAIAHLNANAARRPVRRAAPRCTALCRLGPADVNDSFVLRVYGSVDSAQSQSAVGRQRDLI